MTSTWDLFLGYAMDMGIKVSISLLIYLGFHLGGIILKNIFDKLAGQVENGKGYVIHLIGKTIKVSLIIVGAITALGTFGVNVSAMVAGLGLTGFALGFALKDLLSNILAGVLILFYQPFRVGGRIKMGAFEGDVVEIDLRYTTLLGSDNVKVLIPNSKLFSDVVVVIRPAS